MFEDLRIFGNLILIKKQEVLIMAFIYEVVPEKDYEFFKSMGLKNCWGSDALTLNEGYTKWSANREKNAYLVDIGGGLGEVPHFYDLWWNKYVIRMEMYESGSGNYDVGVNICWVIEKISIPKNIWNYKYDVLKMINEAFLVNKGWCRSEYLKSINVKIDCEPEMMEE